MSTTKKCRVCKKFIYLTEEGRKRDNRPFVSDRKNSYVHEECFIKEKTTNKTRKKTVEQCEEKLKELREKTQKILQEENDKENLLAYLRKTYNVIAFSSTFYNSLDSVFKGTHPRINVAISPETLLDMWISKEEELQEEYAKRKTKNGNIEKTLIYDLSKLITYYDKYIDEKEYLKYYQTNEEKIIKDAERQLNEKIDDEAYQKALQNEINKKREQNNIDIEKLIDEI